MSVEIARRVLREPRPGVAAGSQRARALWRQWQTAACLFMDVPRVKRLAREDAAVAWALAEEIRAPLVRRPVGPGAHRLLGMAVECRATVCCGPDRSYGLRSGLTCRSRRMTMRDVKQPPHVAVSLLRDPPWASLPRATVDRLAAGGKLFDTPAGAIVYSEADTEVFAVVVRGLFRVYMHTSDGRQVTVGYARPGSVLGAATLVGGPAPVFVQGSARRISQQCVALQPAPGTAANVDRVDALFEKLKKASHDLSRDRFHPGSACSLRRHLEPDTDSIDDVAMDNVVWSSQRVSNTKTEPANDDNQARPDALVSNTPF